LAVDPVITRARRRREVNALEVEGLEKRFDALEVLRGVDLSVPAGSFVALLGPSGSGKTTVLRVLAGFERADRGTVAIEGTVVDDARHVVVPERRRVGYVPQEGALFPHMTVERNVGFGLGRHAGRAGSRTKVAALLDMVGLAGLGARYPHQLSGGQQQRVALARALAVSPSVILLDEPFASLDAEMRAAVRADVLDVLRRAGTTTLFVTHDQDEALSSADRVAVLVDGRIAQVSAPRDLYARPTSPAVALFLGAMNLVPGTFEGARVRTGLGVLEVAAGEGAAPRSGPAVVLVRPEQLEVTDEPSGWPGHGEVVRVEFLGHDVVVHLRADGDDRVAPLVARVAGNRPLALGARVGMRAAGPVVAWAGSKAETSPAGWKNTSM
jgi:iron(III) transport system ATP-binding protein